MGGEPLPYAPTTHRPHAGPHRRPAADARSATATSRPPRGSRRPTTCCRLGDDLPDQPVAEYKRRIGPWILWRAGPATKADARYWAARDDDLADAYTLRLFADGTAEGVGPERRRSTPGSGPGRKISAIRRELRAPSTIRSTVRYRRRHMNLGGPELLIVLIVILLLFGGAKLPKLARSLGQAQNEFKSGLKEGAAKAEEDEKHDRSLTGRGRDAARHRSQHRRPGPMLGSRRVRARPARVGRIPVAALSLRR